MTPISHCYFCLLFLPQIGSEKAASKHWITGHASDSFCSSALWLSWERCHGVICLCFSHTQLQVCETTANGLLIKMLTKVLIHIEQLTIYGGGPHDVVIHYMYSHRRPSVLQDEAYRAALVHFAFASPPSAARHAGGRLLGLGGCQGQAGAGWSVLPGCSEMRLRRMYFMVRRTWFLL